jgi:hypothetical protein
MLPPVILSRLDGPGAATQRALQHLTTTHESRKLAGYAQVGREGGRIPVSARAALLSCGVHTRQPRSAHCRPLL